MSRVVATVGVIPGAGATTVVTALGSALAEQRSHVALVDASAEGSRIADVLPLDGDGEVADALRRRADLSDVQASGPHDLRAFPAAPETNWEAVRPGAVATAYDRLRERFELVLVDCGSELTPASAAWIGYADELVVVSCPEVADATEEIAALGAAYDVPVRGVVANRVVPDERDDTLAALEASPHQPLAVFPEDPTVDAAATERRSVLVHEPDSQIASCAWTFARRFREGDHAEPVVPDAWGSIGGNDRDANAGATNGSDGNAGGNASDVEAGGTDASVANAGGTATSDASDGPTADERGASSQPATTDGGSGTAAAAGSAADDAAADEGDTGFEWSSSEDLDGDDSDDSASSASSLGSDIGADLAGSDDEDASDGTSGDRDSVADGGSESSVSDAGSALDENAAGDGSEDSDDGTEISDEEIEAVFKETMQQAKEERDAEAESKDGDEDDDSVLGGFMGN